MIDIIKRFKSIHIDAFTYSERYFDFYKPIPVQQLSNSQEQKGHVIPLWSDMAININNKPEFPMINWAFCDTNCNAQIHSNVQFQGFVSYNKLQHLKIITPWQFKEKTGCKFVFFQPSWTMKKLNNHLTVISGITDFKYQNSTNIQMFLHYSKNTNEESLLIDAGTPLYQFVPVSDRPVKIHYHIVEERLYNSMNVPDKFSNMYFHRKQLIEKKCPFH